jgi:sugar O-acyltransferase (sialic acid O-acetyltransferase NeuD family)
MESRICLLGFSGSVLSLIFSTLEEMKWSQPVLILENIKVMDEVQFQSNVPYSRMWHEEYISQPGDAYCFSMLKPSIKKTVFDFFLSHHGITRDRYMSIAHPSVITSASSIVEKGVYIEPGCVISPYAKIGFGVSINRGCTIGHHTQIDDFATVNPGTHIAGHCKIGAHTSIGIGTTVFDHITIGSKCVIGGGSVVNKNIPDGVLAFGNPCKMVKEKIEK